MIEPDYDLKKIKGDSRRKSAVLEPEREIFSAKSEEDEAPSAQERLPARPRRLPRAAPVLLLLATTALPPLIAARLHPCHPSARLHP